MKKVNTVVIPYFEKQLNHWVYRGFTFISKSGKLFAFYQLFEIWGHGTNLPEIKTEWKIFLIKENGDLSPITLNGMKIDGSYLRDNPKEGLKTSEVDSMIKHAKKYVVSFEDSKKAVVRKFEPLIAKKVLWISRKAKVISRLNANDLSTLSEKISQLSPEIKLFYPRSYEKLVDINLLVRKQYAKVKYPKLYSQLEKFHTNEKYKANKDDTIVGFGPRIVFQSVFYNCFISKDQDLSHWKYSSPFEKQFGESTFF